jgi:hypothetical protein
MKAGRPSYHVRSKWITVTTPHGLMYFELDTKGSLVSKKLEPHHFTDFGNVQPPTQEIAPPPTFRAPEQREEKSKVETQTFSPLPPSASSDPAMIPVEETVQNDFGFDLGLDRGLFEFDEIFSEFEAFPLFDGYS